MHTVYFKYIYIHNHAAKLVAFYTFNFKVELHACKLHNNSIIPFFFNLRRRNAHTDYWLYNKKRFCDEFHIRIFECLFLLIK